LKKYRDFKEYMQENYYDELYKSVDKILPAYKESFEDDEITYVKWVSLQDIHVEGVTFKDSPAGELEIRVSVDADVEVQGKAGRDYDSFARDTFFCVFFRGLLEDGQLKHMRVIKTETYEKNEYDKDRSLSQNLVPYMYEEDVEKHAEDFLRRHCGKALLQPMQIPVEEIVAKLQMTLYYAPLEEGIFGKTYFGEEKVAIYEKGIAKGDIIEVMTTPGTMLINPDVYFMYNIGTANNTIIHECVHWDRHQRPFELQKLLNGNSSHISCEIIEKYDGIPNESPALKWMEWQANQLAPRILMPAEMTKKKLNELMNRYHAEHPYKRDAELLEMGINGLSLFFGVSNIAAKIRVIELGLDQAEGVQVFCDGMYLPPYSFKKNSLKKNQTFLIDEQNFMFNVVMNSFLRELYSKSAIVYANCMVCLNDPKYVRKNSVNRYYLTDYALEHVDECCFVFSRKINASNSYSDTFYRRCFLCREVDSSSYIEANYDPEHTINQSKEDMKTQIDIIMKNINTQASKMTNNIPSGFAGTLNFHMEDKKITNEELANRSKVSTVSISGYRNNIEVKIEFYTALALCKGLYLQEEYAIDFMRKAGYPFDVNPTPSRMFAKILVTDHMDDTYDQWVEKIQMANLTIELLPPKLRKNVS